MSARSLVVRTAPGRRVLRGAARRDRAQAAQTFLGILDQGVTAVGGVIPVVLLGRSAGEHQLVVYTLAASAAFFIVIASQSLLLSAYPVLRARNRAASRLQTFHTVLFGASAQAILAVALLLAFVVVRPFGVDLVLSITLVAFVTSTVLRNYLRALSLARKDLLDALVLDSLAVAALSAMLGWLWWHGVATASNVLIGLSLANALFVIAWCRRYAGDMEMRLAGARDSLVGSVRFGAWAFAGVTCGSMPYYVTPWLLALISGTDQTAVYAAATTIVGFVNHALLGLLRGIEARTANAFHRGGRAALDDTLKRTCWIVLPALSAIVLALFPAAHLLGGLILPGRGPEVGAVAAVLALALLVGSIRVIAGNGLWAMNRPAATFPADLLRGVAAVGLGVVAAPYAGALGCAAAILVGDVISSLVVVARFRSASAVDLPVEACR